MGTPFNLSVFALVLIIIHLIIFYVSFLIVVVNMATDRGRSMSGWLIFSIFYSPMLGMLFLFCLGETEEHKRNRMLNEERIKKAING